MPRLPRIAAPPELPTDPVTRRQSPAAALLWRATGYFRRAAMSTHPPFRKVLDRIATREHMFRLFNRHKDTPGIDPISGTSYAGEYFEIAAEQYHFMLALLPPLFQRTGMFGMSEYKAGYVTSVLFAIRIRGRERWFHGFCDLSDKRSPDAMRAAIIAYETGASDSVTRDA
jgi:hypothetical protein